MGIVRLNYVSQQHYLRQTAVGLPHQITFDWGQWWRKELFAVPLLGGYFQQQVHYHDRYRLQDPDNRTRRQENQAANLGHRWAGAIPHYHTSVLPWCHGDPARV